MDGVTVPGTSQPAQVIQDYVHQIPLSMYARSAQCRHAYLMLQDAPFHSVPVVRHPVEHASPPCTRSVKVSQREGKTNDLLEYVIFRHLLANCVLRTYYGSVSVT